MSGSGPKDEYCRTDIIVTGCVLLGSANAWYSCVVIWLFDTQAETTFFEEEVPDTCDVLFY